MTSPHVEPAPRVPVAVLAAAFLFNVGQGVLRPSMPYLETVFAANYRRRNDHHGEPADGATSGAGSELVIDE